MSLAHLNFTALSLNGSVPVSGHSYKVVNVESGRLLDDWAGQTSENNPIVTWTENTPSVTPNQIWEFLSYPATNGDKVFTLQATNTISNNNTSIDGRGGYLRVNGTSQNLVHGGEPQAWTLVQVAETVYKMVPYESVFSNGGKLVATGIDGQDNSDYTKNQVTLQDDTSATSQLWSFELYK